MERELQFVSIDESEAARLLEVFRLYGTKKGDYTMRNLWLLTALTDDDKSFYLTNAYYRSSQNKPDEAEYAIVAGEKVCLVRCTIHKQSKQIDERSVTCVVELKNLEICGEISFSEQKLKEIIIFYEDNSRLNYKLKSELKEKYREKDLRGWNVERQRKLVLNKREQWQACGELLAKEYQFQIIETEQQIKLWKCIHKFDKGFFNCQNKNLAYGLTNAEQSFWLIQYFFAPDGLKHCNEPDDYKYAIITKKSQGTVFVWLGHEVEIKEIKGKIPLTTQELCDAIRYYDEFYYTWCDIYEKKYGKIRKISDELLPAN